MPTFHFRPPKVNKDNKKKLNTVEIMIEPATINITCPVCNDELIVKPMSSDEDTTCGCGYSEPAGSSHFITFLTEVLERFTENLGVKRYSIGNQEFPASSVLLASSGILPAVMLNAKVNDVSSALTDNALPLTLVDDENGLYKKRLVTTGKITNPSLILTTLGETVFQVWKQSMMVDYNKDNCVIDFNNLAPIGVLSETALTNINETANSNPNELINVIMEHLEQ